MPEKRVVLRNRGFTDPGDISGYLDMGGFKATEKIRGGMTGGDIIEEIKASGLRGRGGAGFPCGLKWDLAQKTESDQKYLICNADEGEVGAFKDRYILSNYPFLLIEGIAIAGYAIGADRAYIYIREEYHFLIDLLAEAIKQAEDKGFIDYIKIEIIEGAGAYICGEESALMRSIEGFRGESQYKPPFPPNVGLYGKPTIINNVETLANIPGIIINGSDWFKRFGTEKSKGTKIFSVSGDVAKPGIYEMELGCSLNELVVDLCEAENIKAVQVGGASGHLIPQEKLDLTLAFETYLGSGAITVFNQSRDIIEMVYQTACFFSEESCGKCAPCREGTEVMLEILARIHDGDGMMEDLDNLKDLSVTMELSSLCGLGQAAPTMLLDSLKYYKNEYENRIKQSRLLRMIKGK